MTKILLHIERHTRWIDRLNQILAHRVRWFAFAMVVITFSIAALRYTFSIGSIALQESVIYLHGTLFMLAIPYALQRDDHVRVDLLYSRLSKKHQSWIDITGHLLLLLPLCGFLVVVSLPYVAASWRIAEGSSEVGGIPAIFLLKSLIPAMAILLFLQGVREIVKKLSCISQQS